MPWAARRAAAGSPSPTTAWACDRCDFARPPVDADVVGDELVLADGVRHRLRIGLPGQFNRANAAMAALAAAPMLAARRPGRPGDGTGAGSTG